MNAPANPVLTQMAHVRAQGVNLDAMTREEIFAIGCTEGATLARNLLMEEMPAENIPLKFVDGVGMYLVAAGAIVCAPEDLGELAASHIAMMMRFCKRHGHELPEHLTTTPLGKQLEALVASYKQDNNPH